MNVTHGNSVDASMQGHREETQWQRFSALWGTGSGRGSKDPESPPQEEGTDADSNTNTQTVTAN